MFKDGKRTWSNGTLVFQPDLRDDAFLKDLAEARNVAVEGGKLLPKTAGQPAVLTVEMSSPYVVAQASSQITGGEGLIAELSDDGKNWAPLDLATISQAVAGKYRYLVRLSFTQPITALNLTSILQHNQQALPYLAPGENTITVTADNPAALGDNRLAVTYAYCLGSRRDTPEQVFDAGGQMATDGHPSWSVTPVVVRTIVDRLPATIHIPIPTPEGRQPVYPRMVFLRRELLAPGQAPAEAPAPPSTPSVKAGETLATLPNPWTMGVRPPAALPQGPTESVSLIPERLSYVGSNGEVADHHALRWPKENKDCWVLLLDFDTTKLPTADAFREAKLTLAVRESHDKAPAQAAAVLVDANFKASAPFNFAGLGRTVGTAVVEKGNGPGTPFDPPRTYTLDVSPAVRAWIKDGRSHGLGVRIVPNRAVDDGWTVRFTLDKQQPAKLEIISATGP